MAGWIKTGFPGVDIHGKAIRVCFMYKRVRYDHTLGTSRRNVVALRSRDRHLRGDDGNQLSTDLGTGGTEGTDRRRRQREPADLQVWLNRREHRTEHLEHQVGQPDRALGHPGAPALADPSHSRLLEIDGAWQPHLHLQSDGSQDYPCSHRSTLAG